MSKYSLIPDDTDDPTLCAEAERVLREGGLPEVEIDEYGRYTVVGFKIQHGAGPFEPVGKGRGVRITHKIPDEDLTNPDRRGTDDRWLEKYRSSAVYKYVLERAGWLAELRVTPSNEVIVLARPKGNDE